MNNEGAEGRTFPYPPSVVSVGASSPDGRQPPLGPHRVFTQAGVKLSRRLRADPSANTGLPAQRADDVRPCFYYLRFRDQVINIRHINEP